MGVVALNNAKRLRPVERDLQLLLAHFTQTVEQGSAPTFSTFKKVWTQRHFSWIYLGNSTSLTTDHYVQSLYAMALDCLDVPISEMPMSQTGFVPTSPQAQPEPGANEYGTPPSDMTFTSNQTSDGAQAATASFSNTGDDDEQEGAEDNVSNDVDQDADIDDAEPDLTSRMAEDIPFSEAYAAKLDREEPASQALPGSPSAQAPTLAGAILDDVNIDDEIGDFNGDILADLPAAPFSSPKPAEAKAQCGTHTQHGLPPSDVDMQDADTDHALHNHAQGQPQAIPRRISKPHTLQTDMAGHQQAQKSSAAAKPSPAPVSVVSGPDNGLSELAASIAKLPQLAPSLVAPAAVNGHSASRPVALPAAIINGQSPLEPVALAAGSNESDSASAAPAAGQGESAPVPEAPTLAPGSSGARLMAGVANRPPQPPAAPRRDMYSLDTSHQSQPNPTEVSLATKVGSIFAIYCIYETQPGRTPIYLPLELLHQLLDLAQECHAKGMHDVMRVLRQLMTKRAFVVGAVRRPPSRSAAAEAACNAPSRLAASSLSGAHSKAQKERDCVYHIQCMYRGLGIVGTLGPMCREYKAAKQQACEKAGIQHPPKSIANLTVGAKLPQLLWNATKKMQPLVAQKKLRGPRRKRKKTGDTDPMDADQADADIAGADKDDDSGDELFALLDKGMADLGSDAEGDEQAPPDVEGQDDDDDDDADHDDETDVLEHVNLPVLGGRGAKAAMRRADQRRQRKEQAVRSWRKFEDNVLNGQKYDASAPEDDEAAQQPRAGPASMDWDDVDHSIPAATNDHAFSVTGQAVSNGAQANAQAASSNGAALPRASTPILAARTDPAQVAAAAYERPAGALQTSKVAADAAPAAAAAAATLTAAPDTGAERPASASAFTAERPEPGAAPRSKGKKGRPHAGKNRPEAGQAGAAPSSLQPASSGASLLAVSTSIPAKGSAKPPRPSCMRKRAAAGSPGKQTGNLMAAESLADKGNQQQTKPAAQAHVCVSDAIDPAGEDAVSAALKLMQNCEDEIAYMLDHPDSDLD